MEAKAWSYSNDIFRGYVKYFIGRKVEFIHCTEVRKNKLKALEDAKKLLAKIRKETKLTTSTP